ncbi:tripartite tricarboxylate transporter substrate binding protein [Pigmentiphaga sp. H8]|uniref:Bug family tripartite tricarboxylate transporter substrate binding protein n=1 Tax=Pigmentiphaga sp. H8 TaxID=2488560 RepID=UPI000F5B016D|nr:tripartite tricarboxylate transporter substrate binding protein [Pigmentiphaga sp. H8]AZG07289.1 tripartite tricarboxylate transporter substrate binding protein [Pigmentiphaga sp. H8]
MPARLFGLFLLCMSFSLAAQPSAFPNRPLSIVVTTAAGGSVDAIARAIAADLGKTLGQPVVVENRPGANGNIAAQHVKTSAPDGHTLLMLSSSTFTLNPFVLERVPFNPEKDFVPVAMTAGLNMVLVVAPGAKAATLKELVAAMKARPGELNYGSSGNGSLPQVAAELLAIRTGTRATHVPYKGIAPALNDLLAGQIDFMFDSGTAMSHIQAGKLRALAVIGPNRLPIFPDVPTFKEAGVDGMEVAAGWHGIFAPAGTDPAIVDRLNAEINKSLRSAAMRERMNGMGFESVALPAAELGRALRQDLQRLGPIVKQAGITAY